MAIGSSHSQRALMDERSGQPPRRPIMRYHGGKWRIAPWIISHFPPHKIYVEPFCGAASVLMRKDRSHAEVINDLDGNICNLFRVLRDSRQAAALEKGLRLTPFARDEFRNAYAPTEDPVELARRTLVRAMMGFGTTALRKNKTGFRARSYLRNQTGPVDFSGYPDCIAAFTERLRGVLIENMNALDLIPRHDTPDTLFYMDPPYPHCTRSSITSGGRKGQYLYELTDEDHCALAEVLRSLRGMVVLSGYPCELYDRDLYPDWYRVEREALADGGQTRMEALWLNHAAAKKLQQRPGQIRLFKE